MLPFGDLPRPAADMAVPGQEETRMETRSAPSDDYGEEAFSGEADD